MAPRSKRQRRYTVRFELGLGGLVGLAVVCLCIFIWLFLLGVWAGQTVLSPSSSADSPWLHRFTSTVLPAQPPAHETVQAEEADTEGGGGEPEALDDTGRTPEEESVAPGVVDAEPELAGNSFFALQVGAFREQANAAKAVADWKGKGYEAFSRPPEGGSSLTRVFVGRFNDLAEANKLVAELEEKEKLRAYITLIPAAGE